MRAEAGVPVRMCEVEMTWRVTCHYTPYGVSDSVFGDADKMKEFILERLDMPSLSLMQIALQKKKQKKGCVRGERG